MAIITGNANGHKALLTALKTAMDSNSFTAERYVSNDEYIFSRIFSGSDKWYGGIKIYDNVATNARAWKLNAYSGFASGNTFDNQVGAISTTQLPALTIDENTGNSTLLTYWISLTARRICGVVRVGTNNYQHFYIGLYTQYATPAQLPYPIMVGGSSFVQSDGTIPRYSAGTTSTVYSYWATRFNSTKTTGNLALRKADGGWTFINTYTTGIGKAQGAGVYPYSNFFGNDELYSGSTVENFAGNMMYVKNCTNSCYNLIPILIYDNNPGNIYGELDGLKYVSAFNLTAESTITEGSDTYIVFPDNARSGDGSFIAMKQS